MKDISINLKAFELSRFHIFSTQKIFLHNINVPHDPVDYIGQPCIEDVG